VGENNCENSFWVADIQAEVQTQDFFDKKVVLFHREFRQIYWEDALS
jgi:hypothetical protein